MRYSIIIPCYNTEKYILKALESINNQTYKNLELVIINDGSSDKTEDIVLDFIKSNPTLDIVYKKIENSGPSTARNVGLDLATGDYVCFLDSDDSYDPHLFEEIEAMIKDEYDVIYWGYNEYDEEHKLISKYTDFFEYIDDLTGIEAAKKKYLKELYIHTCTGLYKRSMIEENKLRFVTGIYFGEDYNFIYKALFNAKKVKVIPKALYDYLYRSTSLMHIEFSEKFLTEFDAIRDTLRYIEEHNVPEVYDYIYSSYYYARCTVCKTKIKSMKWNEGFKFLKFAKKYIPVVKKHKVMYLNKLQKRATKIYGFSKLLFFCFTKFYLKKTHQ